jgi:SAM-dependent methyltransferase
MSNADFRSPLKTPVVRDIAGHDAMFGGSTPHYFGVGMSAIMAIEACIRGRGLLGLSTPIQDILDFGSGCGRVTRFLRAAHPDATTWVTDFRTEDVAWCVEHLSCRPAPDVLLHRSFDLIWLGSVFTHLAPEAALQLLTRLRAALRPSGILVFSTHGRHAAARIRHADWSAGGDGPYNIGRPLSEAILRDFDRTGYGYADYRPGANYGISLVRPDWYLSQFDESYSLVYAQERAYDHHQDVLGFVNEPIQAQWRVVFPEA